MHFIHKKLLDVRKKTGRSARYIAGLTGVSSQSVQRYESGRIPPINYLIKLAEKLELRPQYFFYESDSVMFIRDAKKSHDNKLAGLSKEIKTLRTEWSTLKAELRAGTGNKD
jgi:transcriptional regulator with XRE-family HTH domain